MIIRRKLNMKKEQGLFLMVNDGKDIVKANQNLEQVFNTYKDEDGFLYILYTQEDMFGAGKLNKFGIKNFEIKSKESLN